MRAWVVAFALSVGMCVCGLALSTGVWYIWHHFFGGQELSWWLIDTLVFYVIYRDTLDFHRVEMEIEHGDTKANG